MRTAREVVRIPAAVVKERGLRVSGTAPLGKTLAFIKLFAEPVSINTENIRSILCFIIAPAIITVVGTICSLVLG